MCASIIVFVEGSAQIEDHSKFSIDSIKKVKIQRGDIYYIPPNHTLKITSIELKQQIIEENNVNKPETRLLAYRTFSYQPGPDHSKRIIASKRSVSTTALILPTLKEKQRNNLNSFITTPQDYYKNATDMTKNKRIFEVESEMDGFL